jgi:radical SAM superfamily enzyme YgiQ (UPF0313 family)
MSIADISLPTTDSLSSYVSDLTGPADVQPRHPLGGKAKVLLCSIFGPYARDDEYGSRAINPMELWHNQVTRVQGAFSLRMFHRSWGMMLIQANIQARCTCLDFPDLERFIQEIRDNDYDIVGIGAILPNLAKVQKMCQLIRQYLPKARIVVGGHIANLEDLADRVQADHIVRGDGVRWFRQYLGQDSDAPIRHPQIWSGINRHSMGMDLPFNPGSSAATLIPSAGCPMGCNFCSTSAMFGGKGKSVNFFSDATELFTVMCRLEEAMKTRSFFVMDENFLLNRPRAIALLELMQKHEKPWALYVFSSANALRQYTMEELVGLGVSWVWIGLEGKNSKYGKLTSTDTINMVRELQANGIRVQGSSIIGMEEHTPENIDQAIAHAVAHDADFHQFMLYTPVAGTPLHAEHKAKGTLLGEDEISYADAHGQFRFNFRHPHIKPGQDTQFLLRAFEEDFRVNGPSVLRQVKTAMKGWRKYRNHAEKRVRDRMAWEIAGTWNVLAAAVWAGRKWAKNNPPLAQRLDEQLKDIYGEFGLKARIVGPLLGRFLYSRIRREERKLAQGWTTEPPTYYERNYVETSPTATKATLVQSVTGLPEMAAAKSI